MGERDPAPNTGRPTFPEVFLEIAKIMSTRATCPRLSVGVVIVDDTNRIVSTGYNGSPRGLAHCRNVGCNLEDGHCTRAVHSETNAVLNTPDIKRLTGATLYLYGGLPCYRCAQVIITVGIRHIVHAGAEGKYGTGSASWGNTKDYLEEAGVRIDD